MSTEVTGRRRPGNIVIILGFVCLLAGRFTLDRVGVDVPVLNDPRVALLWLLLVIVVIEGRRSRPVEQQPARWNGLAIFLVFAFLAYQFLSATWAPDGARLLRALMDNIVLALLVAVYSFLARWDRDRVVRVTMALFLGAGVVYFLAALSGYGHDPSGRWAALGGGSNVFVRIMVLAGIAALYFFVRSGSKGVFLLPLPVFAIGAVLSGSRGGLLAAAGIVVIAGAPYLFRLRAARVSSVAVPLALAAAGGWLLWGREVSTAVRERLVGATLEEGYLSGRDVLFRQAFDFFQREPVAGLGLDGFYATTRLDSGEQYAHNLPLAVAAEGGLIGLALLLGAVGALLAAYRSVPRVHRSVESRVALFGGLFVGLASLFSGDYYDSRLMWIFLVLAATTGPRKPAAAPEAPQAQSTVAPGRRQ
ncbi:MAG: putative O-antigen polymerase [Blastococcus sp.]|nr:putative O-antigen polymerase [Blastococcus sp.]